MIPINNAALPANESYAKQHAARLAFWKEVLDEEDSMIEKVVNKILGVFVKLIIEPLDRYYPKNNNFSNINNFNFKAAFDKIVINVALLVSVFAVLFFTEVAAPFIAAVVFPVSAILILGYSPPYWLFS